jgi:O-antigen/teichoic acid export membrane protein
MKVAKPWPRNELRLGFWALTDQGVVSLGNFLTQVILARSLARIDYGVFVLLFGVLIVVYACHLSLICYPLTLTAASRDRQGLRRLVSLSLLLTTGFNLPFIGVLLVACVSLHRIALTPWAAVALLFWLLQETTRRGLLAHLRHGRAIWGDAVRYIGQAAVLWSLAHSGRLTVLTALQVIAVTSAAGAALQVLQLGFARVSVREAILSVPSFWRLGRWALLSSGTDAVTFQIFPWALAFFHGALQAAPFQAVRNLLGVTHPILLSLPGLIVPATAKAHQQEGMAAAARSAVRFGTQAGIILFPYYVLLLIWPRAALALLYGRHSPYVSFDWSLRVFVIAHVFVFLFQIKAGLLNGVERPRSVFAAELASTGIALSVGLPLTALWGVAGAAAAVLLMTLSRYATGAFFVAKLPGMMEKKRGISIGELQSNPEFLRRPMDPAEAAEFKEADDIFRI